MNFYTDNENLSFYLHHPEMDPVVAVREKDFAEAGKHPEAPANAEWRNFLIGRHHQALHG